jgi:hypothetical protein
VFKCQHCGKELKNQGSVNLHERKCIKNPDRVDGSARHEGCQHDWKLLNANNPTQARAIQHNYKEVCLKCQELR